MMIKRIFDYKGELMKCENVQLKSQYEEQIRTSYNNLKLENEQLKSNYKKLQRWLKRKHLPSGDVGDKWSTGYNDALRDTLYKIKELYDSTD